jgi:U3 small nucleolar RNA-associated protein 7
MASDSESERSGSDSEAETQQQTAPVATRLGQQQRKQAAAAAAASNKKPAATLKHVDKYARPSAMTQRQVKSIRDKKLRGSLKTANEKHKLAAEAAAKSEMLLPSQAGFLEADGKLERTYKFTQAQLAEAVDQNTARKIFSLDLPDYGAYRARFTRNGRNLLLSSEGGHLALMDSLRMKLTCEFQANDRVRDIAFLHNNSMFAAAQRKYVYIYDSTGAEAHCIRSAVEPRALEFLPYHFLLTTVSGHNGLLTYHDVTTGTQIAAHRSKQGACDVMAQNPWNAVINLGHANGIVSLWTPNMNEAVVKMQCHQGPSTCCSSSYS